MSPELDVLSLLSQRPAARPRRPVAEEMESLHLRDVRPFVEVSQQAVRLKGFGRPLQLHWQWRSGGCFGPRAAQALNQRQRIPRPERSEAPITLDRGSTGGWHMSFLCPACARPCRTLFRQRQQGATWSCRTCQRVTYRSSNRTGGRRGRKPPAYAIDKHGTAAIRIRRDYLGLPPQQAADLFSLTAGNPEIPAGMSQERGQALQRLAMGHEMLWLLAVHSQLDRLARRSGSPFSASGQEHMLEETIARLWLKRNAWATRQSSWKRQGRIRPGPAGRIGQTGHIQKTSQDIQADGAIEHQKTT
jgi:hypothetical protein